MGNSVLYALVVIVGFIVLGAAIYYARATNNVSKRQFDRTEDATRRLYDEQPRQDELPR